MTRPVLARSSALAVIGGALLAPGALAATPAPLQLQVTALSSTALTVTWAAPAAGVRAYTVSLNGHRVSRVPGASTSALIDGLAPSTTYTVTVRARDAAGLASAAARTRATTTAAADTAAPSAPLDLHATGVTGSSISLAWTASNDDVGVAAYRVLQNGVVVATIAGTALTVAGLDRATTYPFTVIAVDAAGNASGSSATLTATTAAS